MIYEDFIMPINNPTQDTVANVTRPVPEFSFVVGNTTYVMTKDFFLTALQHIKSLQTATVYSQNAMRQPLAITASLSTDSMPPLTPAGSETGFSLADSSELPPSPKAVKTYADIARAAATHVAIQPKTLTPVHVQADTADIRDVTEALKRLKRKPRRTREQSEDNVIIEPKTLRTIEVLDLPYDSEVVTSKNTVSVARARRIAQRVRRNERLTQIAPTVIANIDNDPAATIVVRPLPKTNEFKFNSHKTVKIITIVLGTTIVAGLLIGGACFLITPAVIAALAIKAAVTVASAVVAHPFIAGGAVAATAGVSALAVVGYKAVSNARKEMTRSEATEVEAAAAPDLTL